jgi:hypothetical protein
LRIMQRKIRREGEECEERDERIDKVKERKKG